LLGSVGFLAELSQIKSRKQSHDRRGGQ
jgi:hypothetical protein